ncbi:MAG: hypothetical protein QOK48_3732 [Blastocatellia bacterium]|jgi:hypothetical protein|nr:hypothetical protein [Blastocatellia bacterium]
MTIYTKLFTPSLDWLFKISNNRFDIRHVVKDPEKLHLHPKLTGQERADFIQDDHRVSILIGFGRLQKTSPYQTRGDPLFIVSSWIVLIPIHATLLTAKERDSKPSLLTWALAPGQRLTV